MAFSQEAQAHTTKSMHYLVTGKSIGMPHVVCRVVSGTHVAEAHAKYDDHSKERGAEQ